MSTLKNNTEHLRSLIKDITDLPKDRYDEALARRTELEVTENGEYVPEGESTGFSKVNVNVPKGGILPQVIERTITEIKAEDLSGVTFIGEYAFSGCGALVEVDFPNGITSIGPRAFLNSGLISVIMSDGVTSIGGAAFSGCARLKSITIPDSVTSIGGSAFYQCSGLESVVWSKGMTSIANSAFSGCSSLSNIVIPDSVISIEDFAFQSCKKLTSLIVPQGVVSIKGGALTIGESNNKATITFLSTTPPTIQSSTFRASNLNKIIVPKGCSEAYRTATNWSNFADYIEEATE